VKPISKLGIHQVAPDDVPDTDGGISYIVNVGESLMILNLNGARLFTHNDAIDRIIATALINNAISELDIYCCSIIN
jgi:hypothetical protein